MGCFSHKGFGKLVIINAILVSNQMVKICESGLLLSVEKLYEVASRDWQLLENGDSKHTSRLSKAFIAKKG